MLLATALACLYRMYSTDVYYQTNRQRACQRKAHHPSFSSFLELVKKTVDAAKICGGTKSLFTKTETQQTFIKWIAQFYYTEHLYSAGAHCVLLTIIHGAHRYGQLYLHCSLIYFWVPFQLFLHSDQPLSEGEIIPFSGVCQSGEAALSRRRRGGFTHWLTDCFDVQPTTIQRRHHHAEHHFSALASANSFVYFASSAATSALTHLHVGNCRVHDLQFSGIFLRWALCM